MKKVEHCHKCHIPPARRYEFPLIGPAVTLLYCNGCGATSGASKMVRRVIEDWNRLQQEVTHDRH